MQIWKFAEKHGLESKDVLSMLKEKGFTVKSPLSKITDEMIMAINLPQKVAEEKPQPEVKAESDGTKYYYSDSERLTFGGFKPERRREGYVEPDESIQFDNHIYITADKAKQDFIESTQIFGLGRVKIVTFEDYHKHMEAIASRRQQVRMEAMARSGRQG